MSAVESFRRRPARLVLAAVVVVTSLLMYDYARASGADRPAPRFSGAELTRGVLFMEGAAAPYIWGSKMLAELAPQIAQPMPDEAELLALMTRDEKVNAAFAADLQSGSPVRAERALRALGGRLQDALVEIHGAEKMAALQRAGQEFADQVRSLVGQPDFGSGAALRDFSDTAPAAGGTGDDVSRARVPDVVSQNLLLFFRAGNIFLESSIFVQYTTAVQLYTLGVLGVALAAIVFFFVIVFLVVPALPDGRHSEGIERFLTEEFLARVASDLDAT